jgi:hypothetical protein
MITALGLFFSNYLKGFGKLELKEYSSHYNEIINLNKLRLKKNTSKKVSEKFTENVSKVLFHQFLNVNKSFEKALVNSLYEMYIDFNIIFQKVVVVIPRNPTTTLNS